MTASLLTPAADEFRESVREFVRQHAPRSDVRDGLRVPADTDEERTLRRWYADLFSAGLLGAGWPAEWGGEPDRHRTFHDTILMEELIRGRAPRPLDQTLLAAHCLIAFGSHDQQARFLPPIRSGEHIWCQLFSEPGVGSDLAALSTRAVPLQDGSGFRVDGQKVWSTDAQWAQMGMLLARTDPSAKIQQGITAFLLPMDTPGIDVRPLMEMTGSSEFCEVFLDGVTVSRELVLGEVNRGWDVVTSGLASERGYVGANAVQLEVMHADLVELARAVDLDGRLAIEHEDIRHQLASLKAEVEAVRTSAARASAEVSADELTGAEALVAKLTYTELNVRLCQVATQLIAAGTGASGVFAGLRDNWFHSLLWSRSLTISGGSSEILRSLIAQQMLGLPRSWSRAT